MRRFLSVCVGPFGRNFEKDILKASTLGYLGVSFVMLAPVSKYIARTSTAHFSKVRGVEIGVECFDYKRLGCERSCLHLMIPAKRLGKVGVNLYI